MLVLVLEDTIMYQYLPVRQDVIIIIRYHHPITDATGGGVRG